MEAAKPLTVVWLGQRHHLTQIRLSFFGRGFPRVQQLRRQTQCLDLFLKSLEFHFLGSEYFIGILHGSSLSEIVITGRWRLRLLVTLGFLATH
jgi:hypothetical protein